MRGLKVMFSNEKTIEKEDNTEKFKAFQKRFFMLGIGFLIVASVLYVLLHSLAENPHIIIEFFIFGFAIFSVILIFIGLVMTKDTNWVSLVGSTVFLFCCLLVLIFYPDQEFQQRLNTISLVAIIGTLLFGVFDVFINAVFFPSKNAEIRQSVDFVSNRFAVDVLTVTLIIGTLFGTIAYLFFVPNNNLLLFLGGIDIKTVALATAGLVTFFWAAKAAKNKSIELEEKKQDGKRRDKEIKMAEARDTAQLIAKASELLGSESDAQKNAGLAFLNKVASQKGGPLQKEAFDLLADFILSASDTTTSNKPRMRAITYVNNQIENSCHEFKIYGWIEISRNRNNQDEIPIYIEDCKFKNLNISYRNFIFSSSSIILNTYSPKKVCYKNCFFIRFHRGDIPDIPIFAYECHFFSCNIKAFNFDRCEEQDRDMAFYYYFVTDTFEKCDFSGIEFWEELRLHADVILRPENFVGCYFFNEDPPEGFNADRDKEFLVGYDPQDVDKKQSGND